MDDSTISVFLDPPHATDNLVEKGQAALEYGKETIHVVVKEIYSFLAKSGKRTRLFEEVCEKLDLEPKQIHYLYSIRFIESEYRCFVNFLYDYRGIVDFLAEWQVQNTGTTADVIATKSKVTGWLAKLRQFKFVAIMVMSTDVHFVSKVFSKTTQSDSNTVLEYAKARKQYHASLTKSATVVGAEVERALDELASGSFKEVKLSNCPVDIHICICCICNTYIYRYMYT